MIRDQVSPLDGRKTLQAVVFAKGHDPASTGDYGGLSLVVRCREGQLFLGLMGFGCVQGVESVRTRLDAACPA